MNQKNLTEKINLLVTYPFLFYSELRDIPEIGISSIKNLIQFLLERKRRGLEQKIGETEMISMTLFVLYLLFNLTDSISTWYGLRNENFKEFNLVLRRFSLLGMVLIKALVCLVAFAMLQISWDPFGIAFLEFSLVISTVYFAVVSFYNLVLIVSEC